MGIWGQILLNLWGQTFKIHFCWGYLPAEALAQAGTPTLPLWVVEREFISRTLSIPFARLKVTRLWRESASGMTSYYKLRIL